jgi:hypothetical protein
LDGGGDGLLGLDGGSVGGLPEWDMGPEGGGHVALHAGIMMAAL